MSQWILINKSITSLFFIFQKTFLYTKSITDDKFIEGREIIRRIPKDVPPEPELSDIALRQRCSTVAEGSLFLCAMVVMKYFCIVFIIQPNSFIYKLCQYNDNLFYND
ncbi:hypothetical protein P8452_66660 [Trifolium repens]|nr:hypothetical protein P8452_66660 [Trifolium repens]